MLEVPVLDRREQEVFAAATIFQLRARIVVERTYIGAADRSRLRIVIGLLVERIDRGPREARVEASGGRLRIVLQVLLEHAAVDAQIGLQDVPDRQAGIVVQLLRDYVALLIVERRTGLQRQSIIAHRKVLHLAQELAQIVRLLARQLVVIPGRR